MSKKVFVGMSGGVDSSLAAALLVDQGYEVTGVYMKNWSKDLPGFPCPWKEDYQDAKRVAVSLRIPFQVFDFETEYYDKVVRYMLDGFKSGITPNPDVMCNQEIKFKLFYELAREQGADYVATGHYARTSTGSNTHSSSARGQASSNGAAGLSARGLASSNSGGGRLLKAADSNKDQTYFLYRVSSDALAHTLFPLGGMTKPQVRKEAKKRGLVTANKKESMGICFVGKVGIREFISQFVDDIRPGRILDQHKTDIGEHDGAIYYTIGQRHGLSVGGGLPYYVTGKNMAKNEVYVTSDIADPDLWTDTLRITSIHWITDVPIAGSKYQLRTRHRAALVDCTVDSIDKSGELVLKLDDPIRAATPGQSAVLYDAEVCLGGGIIC